MRKGKEKTGRTVDFHPREVFLVFIYLYYRRDLDSTVLSEKGVLPG